MPPFELDATPAAIVGRLFPEAGRTGVSLDGMIPGRYWPAGEFPDKDATDLDRAVKGILDRKRKPRFSDRTKLTNDGLICPYYSWRSIFALAAIHANRTSEDCSLDKRKALQDELDAWKSRIAKSKMILRSRPDLPIPMGSIYLTHGDVGEEGEREAVFQSRSERFAKIYKEIKLDEEMCNSLQIAIDRIDRLREGKSGANMPDVWLTSFFILPANLWAAMTDGSVPFNSGRLIGLLDAGIKVISGSSAQEVSWGQAVSLHKRFKDCPIGQGFRIWESGYLNLESAERLSDRGGEMQRLIWHETRLSNLSYAAIELRDNVEGYLAFVMREIVLKRTMRQNNMLNPRAAIQLGWLNEPTDQDIKQNLLDTVNSARRQDCAAIAVLRVACLQPDIQSLAERLGWADDSHVVTESLLWRDLGVRDQETPNWFFRTGDHKAFKAAMKVMATPRRGELTTRMRLYSTLLPDD